METPRLENIASPRDLKALPMEALPGLCREIRALLIETTAKNGGHLASNLGVVELTVALHRVYDCPQDKIVFDVGHQSYVHKILTGRRTDFAKIRTQDGPSGFPKREESPCDAFDTGHSSTSLSAALGLLRAMRLRGEPGFVAALIGDGALTGGMAFEALNDIGASELPLVIVFNDNEMSIARNVGALSRHINELRASGAYQRFKRGLEDFLRKRLRNGARVHKSLSRLRDRLKYFLLPNNVFFETMGIKYWGPVDGHDCAALEDALRAAKALMRPVVVHAVTKKGKGYGPAEAFPERYHGVGPFDVQTGEIRQSGAKGNGSVVCEALLEAAGADERIAAVCAAMPAGTGLQGFGEHFPARFFDVGIAEEHAVTMAAGMAAGGMRPVVAVYASFLQRAYDQMLHDVCLQRLPVLFCIDRAGLVGEDGETHQGIYDLACLFSMPGIEIWSPATQAELRAMIPMALGREGPVAIRYPRAPLPAGEENGALAYGKWKLRMPLRPCTVVATGRMAAVAEKACAGLDVGFVCASFLRPMDTDMLARMRAACTCVCVVEDALASCGFGVQLGAALCGLRVVRLGVGDAPVRHGTLAQQDACCGLRQEDIRSAVLKLCTGEDGA